MPPKRAKGKRGGAPRRPKDAAAAAAEAAQAEKAAGMIQAVFRECARAKERRLRRRLGHENASAKLIQGLWAERVERARARARRRELRTRFRVVARVLLLHVRLLRRSQTRRREECAAVLQRAFRAHRARRRLSTLQDLGLERDGVKADESLGRRAVARCERAEVAVLLRAACGEGWWGGGGGGDGCDVGGGGFLSAEAASGGDVGPAALRRISAVRREAERLAVRPHPPPPRYPFPPAPALPLLPHPSGVHLAHWTKVLQAWPVHVRGCRAVEQLLLREIAHRRSLWEESRRELPYLALQQKPPHQRRNTRLLCINDGH